MKMQKPLKIYTDGSSQPHKGKTAGWATVFVFDVPFVMHGYIEPPSTNIVSETLAVIYALEVSALKNIHTIIYADCNFAKNALYEWRKGWERNGFPTKNRALIMRLFEAFDNHPMAEIRWIKGHAGHKYNEIADIYAKYGRDKTILPTKKFVVNYFDSVEASDKFVQKLKSGNN